MSCLFFVFLFTYLAMHACNARHLGVVMDDHTVSDKKHLFSNKVVESVEQTNKEESMIFIESDEVKMPKGSGKQEGEMSGVVQVSVSVSVSDKDLDVRSGFFSDYSTPRTRPPSHN
ncbi:hypothetical protein F3Y22_tig00110319pilonHSYRG00079 [Hibiscus syriacus]|uniref:Uncharacterized protein n=1 Tax=Hibiscus syriacus TaxID=106335 RepID=A0A6A3B164_HIBSY|nr:hypothetical protein F3Y22_tig00110319pilonHSYRG00079 [Hibiscus syriacus]